MTPREANADVLAEITALRDRVASLTRENAELQGLVAQATSREAATGEILRVIRQSPTDVRPVFDAIVQNAARLCDGVFATLISFDGELMRLEAAHNWTPEAFDHLARRILPAPPSRALPAGRAILDCTVIHLPDIELDQEFGHQELTRAVGFRSILTVPMLRDGAPLGAISVARAEPGAFSDNRIALLKTFADQAVIAIENVRLFKELEARNHDLTEALEQQTASGEILRVISSSPTDVTPVFDAICRSAVRLLGAHQGGVFRFDGNLVHIAALTSLNPEAEGRLRKRFPRAPNPHAGSGRAILEKRVFQIPDTEDFPFEGQRATARDFGFRRSVWVPMIREERVIGVLSVNGREPGPYSEREIALLQTFADQAVIAIENVRLFTELQDKNRALTEAHTQVSEALDQQTATSEILRVISSSPTDVQPVLDAVAENATRLCGATDALIYRVEAGMILRVAHFGPVPSVSDTRPVTRETVTGRSMIERRAIHVHDLVDELAHGEYAETRNLQEGIRTVLCVPLTREDSVLGAITIRRTRANPFTEPQIELLKTFANQAVIAIENVRLFTELQTSNHELTTALDTQTATSDILSVISRTQTDAQPVFDAIVTSAVRLLGAYSGVLTRVEGDQIQLAALTSINAAFVDALRATYPRPLHDAGAHARAIRDRAPVNIADIDTDRRLPEPRRVTARIGGYRSFVAVPLVHHDEALGALGTGRSEPGGFTEDEIALLQTFADQAVIAIENVRLFTELQEKNRALTGAHAQVTEALEQQTATSEILRVISSSPTDVQPVLDAVARRSVELCDAYFANLFLVEGAMVHWRASHNVPPEANALMQRTYPLPTSADETVPTIVRERRMLVVEDAQRADQPRQIIERSWTIGLRSWVGVPLLREERAIGVLAVARREVKPFSDKQISLLQTFADQAVIAIENVRLFKELEARNQDLTEALEQQTATSEVLKVISRSTFDLRPVLEILVENATRLCGAQQGFLFTSDGELHHLAVEYNAPPAFKAWALTHPSRTGDASIVGRVAHEGRVIQILDAQADPAWRARNAGAPGLSGVRSLLGVPMRREGVLIGVVAMWRTAVRPYTDKERQLVETFADQAVIAIENVRLVTELQARTQDLTRSVAQLTALREVGHAVSSSLDLETVLNTIVARAVQLAGAHSGTIWEYEAAPEEFVLRITQNVEDPVLRSNPNARVRRGEGAVGRLAVGQRPVQIPDITHEGAYEGRLRDSLVGAGTRALLAIPLLHENQLLGGLVISRRTPDSCDRSLACWLG